MDRVPRFFASSFLMNQFPSSPRVFLRKFTEIFARLKCTTGINDTGRQNCRRYQWHRWQIMGTISGCKHLKVNLKAKIYIYVNSTTQRCPNKIIFLFEDFFPFAIGVTVNDTGGAPWAANISANFRKNLKRPWWYTQGLGENWFMKKTRSRKSRGTVPLSIIQLKYHWSLIPGAVMGNKLQWFLNLRYWSMAGGT